MSQRSIRVDHGTLAAVLMTAIVMLNVASATAAPLLTVRDGKVTAAIAAIPLADLKTELEFVAAVDIRMANVDVAKHPVTASIAGEDVADALDHMLRGFNFTRYSEPGSGRLVYLVISLADPNAPKTVLRQQPGDERNTHVAVARGAASARLGSEAAAAVAPPIVPGAALARASTSKPTDFHTLDDIYPVTPPTFGIYADQSIIDSETARVRQQTLDRAHSVLANAATPPELQRQALNELTGLADPRSVQTLQQLINDGHVLDAPAAAQAVAEATWRYAAQQQFANPEANRLLQTMADSAQPQIRSVGEAAMRDARNYLARNPNR